MAAPTTSTVRRGRRGLLLCLFAALYLLAPPVPLASAQSDGEVPTGPYRGLARADAVHLQLIVPGAPAIPQGRLLDGGSAVAQAELDSTGVSRGFAAAPTPGNDVTSLPLVVNGLLGGAGPPLPGYPLEVHSTHPIEPQSEVRQGPYVVSSESDEASSESQARIGVLTSDDFSVGASIATARTYRDANGAMVSESRSRTEGISVGPLLRIGDVAGYAKVTTMPGEEPEIETSFDIGTITVAGTKVGLTSNGLEPVGGVLGNVDAAVLDQILAPLGIGVRYLPAQEIEGGVDSGGLQLTFEHEVEVAGNVQVSITLGRVLAFSEAAAAVPVAIPDLGSAAGPSAPTPAPEPSSVAPSTGAPLPPTPAPAPVSAPQTTSTEVAPTPTQLVAGSPVEPVIPAGWSRFYVILLVGGVAAMAAGHFFASQLRPPKWSNPSTATLAAYVHTPNPMR